MYTGKTLFAQLMDFLPWTTFNRIVTRYNGDHRVRTLTCTEQFRILAFAQLTYRESLRDIEVCLAAQAGKVVPLMVLGAQRSPDLPNVPSSNELGIKGFENIGWMGLAVRAGTPDAIVDRLHAISQEFLADPVSQQRLQKMQVELMPGPANTLESYIAADTKRWAEATKSLKLGAD